MKIHISKDSSEAAQFIVLELKNMAESSSNKLRGFVPTGKTPGVVYKELSKDKLFWSKHLSPIQIDEFIQTPQVFRAQLNAQLFKPLDIEGVNIDANWSDKDMEAHIAKVVSEPIDFALLGLGPNGHVGFHEPSNFGASFLGGRVRVSYESAQRVEGAKTQEAYSFAVGAFLKAKKIIMLVTGDSKKDILEKFIQAEPNPELPASLLKGHHDFTVVTDIAINQNK